MFRQAGTGNSKGKFFNLEDLFQLTPCVTYDHDPERESAPNS